VTILTDFWIIRLLLIIVKLKASHHITQRKIRNKGNITKIQQPKIRAFNYNKGKLKYDTDLFIESFLTV
jgi:hypothetical protein